jgi:hypothetical protein
VNAIKKHFHDKLANEKVDWSRELFFQFDFVFLNQFRVFLVEKLVF